MSRAISGKQKATKPKPHSIPRCVGREVSKSKWRCAACTFLNEGDSCSMCGTPKPAMARANINVFPSNKPSKAFPKREETKKRVVTVYDDHTDNSVNVAGLGIKKYKYDPKRLPSNFDRPQQKHQTGLRDLMGDLQAAATDQPMPCMRNKKK